MSGSNIPPNTPLNSESIEDILNQPSSEVSYQDVPIPELAVSASHPLPDLPLAPTTPLPASTSVSEPSEGLPLQSQTSERIRTGAQIAEDLGARLDALGPKRQSVSEMEARLAALRKDFNLAPGQADAALAEVRAQNTAVPPEPAARSSVVSKRQINPGINLSQPVASKPAAPAQEIKQTPAKKEKEKTAEKPKEKSLWQEFKETVKKLFSRDKKSGPKPKKEKSKSKEKTKEKSPVPSSKKAQAAPKPKGPSLFARAVAFLKKTFTLMPVSKKAALPKAAVELKVIHPKAQANPQKSPQSQQIIAPVGPAAPAPSLKAQSGLEVVHVNIGAEKVTPSPFVSPSEEAWKAPHREQLEEKINQVQRERGIETNPESLRAGLINQLNSVNVAEVAAAVFGAHELSKVSQDPGTQGLQDWIKSADLGDLQNASAILHTLITPPGNAESASSSPSPSPSPSGHPRSLSPTGPDRDASATSPSQ